MNRKIGRSFHRFPTQKNPKIHGSSAKPRSWMKNRSTSPWGFWSSQKGTPGFTVAFIDRDSPSPSGIGVDMVRFSHCEVCFFVGCLKTRYPKFWWFMFIQFPFHKFGHIWGSLTPHLCRVHLRHSLQPRKPLTGLAGCSSPKTQSIPIDVVFQRFWANKKIPRYTMIYHVCQSVWQRSDKQHLVSTAISVFLQGHWSA